MKKFLFLAIGAMGAMTSCSDADVDLIDSAASAISRQNAISFQSSFVQKSNKALTLSGDLNANDLIWQTIYVWGDRYDANDTIIDEQTFEREPLKYNAKTKYWDYEPVSATDKYKYWAVNKEYDFAAVAPAGVEAEYDGDCIKHRKFTIKNIPVVQQVYKYYHKDPKTNKVVEKDSLGTDILVSLKKHANVTDGVVQLTFRHILSRFSVYTYTNLGTPDNQKYPDDLEIRLKNMKIYLPSEDATATYKENSHEGPVTGKDEWEWKGFTNSTVSATNYQAFDLMDTKTLKVDTLVPVAANPTEARTKSIKMAKEFFIAPTNLKDSTAEDLQLFMDISYTAGHQVAVKDKDGNIVKDAKGNIKYKYEELRSFDYKQIKIDDLHNFKQGYQTNLYVCLTEPSSTVPIRFKVQKVDNWDSYTKADGTTTVGSDDNNYVTESGESFGMTTASITNFTINGILNNMGNAYYNGSAYNTYYDKDKDGNYRYSKDGKHIIKSDFTNKTDKLIKYYITGLKRVGDATNTVYIPKDTVITFNRWYSDPKCEKTSSVTPSATYRYGKFSFKLDDKVIKKVKKLPVGEYILYIRSSVNDAIETKITVTAESVYVDPEEEQKP